MERRIFLNGLVGVGTAYSMSAAIPPQFLARDSKEKWAVVFGTWCGTARDAGIWISEGMGGIAAVFDARQRPDLKAYDHLIIGTAIHSGRGPKELEDLLQTSAADITNKIRAYYVVCGSGGDRPGPQVQTNYIDNYLAKLCRTPAPMNRVFPGRITKVLLSETDYKALEAFHRNQNRPFDDYDHLARWECMEFGRQVLISRSTPPKKI